MNNSNGVESMTTNKSSSGKSGGGVNSAPLSEQLFHGSGHVFKTGDIVSPANFNVAYSTTNEAYARTHAQEGNYRPPSTMPAEQRKHWQMPLFSMVYKVEPVDLHEMRAATDKWNKEVDEPENSDVRVSQKGFKVTGVHEFVPKGKRTI